MLRTDDGGRCPDARSATSADAATHGFVVVGLDRTGVDGGCSAAAHGSPSPESALVDSRRPDDMSSCRRSCSSSRSRWLLLNIMSMLLCRWCRRRSVVAAGSSLKIV